MGTYTDWNSSLLPIPIQCVNLLKYTHIWLYSHTKNEMCLHKLNESLYVRAHTKTAEDNSMRVRDRWIRMQALVHRNSCLLENNKGINSRGRYSRRCAWWPQQLNPMNFVSTSVNSYPKCRALLCHSSRYSPY